MHLQWNGNLNANTPVPHIGVDMLMFQYIHLHVPVTGIMAY